jgi:cholestenol Delta-isomerase
LIDILYFSFFSTNIMIETIKDSMPSASDIDIPSHPFYPLGVDIVDYLANKWSVATLLGIFLAGWLAILGLTWASVSRYSPGLRRNDKLVILWFVLSKPFAAVHFYWPTDTLSVIGGTIHFFFEGYFALNHSRMGPAQDLFGQLWKEYALSDSRYLTSDPFVLCMESITAVWTQEEAARFKLT